MMVSSVSHYLHRLQEYQSPEQGLFSLQPSPGEPWLIILSLEAGLTAISESIILFKTYSQLLLFVCFFCCCLCEKDECF